MLMHLRIDTIEQAIRDATAADAVGTASYMIAYGVAEDNLRLGRTVVADCVNALETTRASWAAVAERSAVALVQVEVVCSDPLEHRRRVESRRVDIRGLTLPTWDEVMARDYQRWTAAHAVIDTAHRPVEECVIELHTLLLARERGLR
jgi:predicted kinase